jgi:hypothetical protein
MRLRPSFIAKPSVLLAGWLALLVCSAACSWQPTARPVRPEKLADGAFVAVAMLDASQFAAVRSDNDAPRWLIADLQSRTLCELPEDVVPFGTRTLQTPSAFDLSVRFLWPVARVAEDDTRTLSFSDERCRLTDTEVRTGAEVYPIALDEDGREALVFGDGRGTFSLYDPWLERSNVIATGVGRFAQVSRPRRNDRPVGPQAFWLIESGELTQRALDGTELLRRGKSVSAFSQAAFAQLRVAYVDGGNLYESVAPDYRSTLIAEDACNPSYGGTELSFFSPCDAQQLVRVDLTNGTFVTFEPGVFREWKDSGIRFERARAGNEQLLFVTFPDGERTRVEPTLFSDLQVIGSEDIVGTDAEGRFGVWNPRAPFMPLLYGVAGILPFVDVRTAQLFWLVLHQVEGGVGQLAALEQPKLSLRVIADGVPITGVAVEVPLTIPEPFVAFVRDATVTSRGGSQRFTGTLEAQLIGGELGTTIDEQVTSYIYANAGNLPALLYTTSSEAGDALWLAAL